MQALNVVFYGKISYFLSEHTSTFKKVASIKLNLYRRTVTAQAPALSYIPQLNLHSAVEPLINT
ncbi:MAG: hypothetical protein ACLFS4_03875, partial [Opitutales bacterium]